MKQKYDENLHFNSERFRTEQSAVVPLIILEVQLLPFPAQSVVRPTDVPMIPERTKSTLLLCLGVLLAQAEGVFNESPHFLLFPLPGFIHVESRCRVRRA
jgi:hypothetical protein